MNAKRPYTILVAPDKFKGTLSAEGFCDAVEEALQDMNIEIQLIKHPMADGGDGSLEILKHHLNAEEVTVKVNDPLFRPIEATYLLKGDTAYIEMAAASGIALLQPEERNCMNTTSYGFGELIQHALTYGTTNLFLFIGGSSTCDAGMGMASALGYQFLDASGETINPIGQNLQKVAGILSPEDRKRINVTTLCDVKNPLYGLNGSAYVYAPQKGASEDEVIQLDMGLKHFAEQLKVKLDKDIAHVEGAGAAGGMGAGTMAFLDAQLQSGTQTMMQLTQFEEALHNVDLIITGEGKLDAQTLSGKVVQGVANEARRKSIPVVAIAGSVDLTPAQQEYLGLQYTFSVLDAAPNLAQAMREPKTYIRGIIKQHLDPILRTIAS
ncbi:glycerate kinase [Winogradskyella sp.]|uniref:glycerate kinase n=1 Tax=Winogradskyella sp. TaxID=1883156 RepID=UPI003BA8AA9D